MVQAPNIGTVAKAVVDKRKKKKEEENKPTTTAPIETTAPTTTAAEDVSAQQIADERNIARFGTADPSKGQILQALFALERGGGQLSGFEGVQPGVTPGQFAPGARLGPGGQQLTGQIGELKAGLTEQILGPQEITPETLGQRIEGGVTPTPIPTTPISGVIQALGGEGKATFLESISDTAFGKKLTVATTGVGAVALGAAAAPFVLAKATAAFALAKSSTLAASITGAAVGAGGYVIGGKITDINRGEIENLRGSLTKIPGQSSTTLSAVQTGGLTPEQGIQALTDLISSVDYAESRIKEASKNNFRYLRSKEYLEVMQEIKDARLNIVERLGGIQTVIETGRPQLDPEALMFSMLEG